MAGGVLRKPINYLMGRDALGRVCFPRGFALPANNGRTCVSTSYVRFARVVACPLHMASEALEEGGAELSTTCRLFRYPVAAGTGTTRRATPAPSTPPPRPPRLPRCSSPTSPLRELVHRTRAAGATSAPPRGHKKTAREAEATRAKRKRGRSPEVIRHPWWGKYDLRTSIQIPDSAHSHGYWRQ